MWLARKILILCKGAGWWIRANKTITPCTRASERPQQVPSTSHPTLQLRSVPPLLFFSMKRHTCIIQSLNQTPSLPSILSSPLISIRKVMRTPILLKKDFRPMIFNEGLMVACIPLKLLLVAVRIFLISFCFPYWLVCCDVREPVLLAEVPVWVAVRGEGFDKVFVDVAASGGRKVRWVC